MTDRNDGLQEIIDEALDAMAAEAGGDFDPRMFDSLRAR